MSVGTGSLAIPTLDVAAESVQRALQAARAPAAAVAAARPDVRAVLQAARAACKELGGESRSDLLQRACLVRFAPAAWPAQDFHRCVLTCVAAYWLGAGQPFGWLEQGPGVFQAIEGGASEMSASQPDEGFHTTAAALRPAFQPEVLSLSCCANRARDAVGLVDVDALLRDLPGALRDVASQERFCHTVAGGTAAGAVSGPRSLFWNSPLGVMAALDLRRTRPARAGDAAALRVLRELDALARQRAVWLAPQTGEVLFLRNHRVLHALRGAHGQRRMLCTQWRGSLLALGNLAGTQVPGMFSIARAMRTAGVR